MGESLVEAPEIQNKMGEAVVPCLQESVSFGRFEHDSLCWERWSTFPTNKYLEEVEKYSTPGSVAQKKAYFEAHYKRVAARKAELLDLEKKRESELMSFEDQSQTSMGPTSHISDDGLDVVESNNENPSRRSDLENEEEAFTSEVVEAEVFDETNEVVIITSAHIDEEICGDLCPQMVKAELVFVKEEGSSTRGSQDMEEFPEDKEREIANIEAENSVTLDCLGTMHEELAQDKAEEREISEVQAEDVKKFDSSKKTPKESPEIPRKTQKEAPQVKCQERKVIKRETKAPVNSVNPKKVHKEMTVKRTANSVTNAKKRVESHLPKKSSPLLSTPKSSRPVLSKSTVSTTRPLVKKENGFAPLTSKKSSRPETKRVLPTSLHMSLSLGPANSDHFELTTTRKSLIMETMGDKDIVKRAFKAFHNFDRLPPSSLNKAPATKQKKTEKGSTLDISEKKHEGITRTIRPSSLIPRQVGIKKTAILPGLNRTVGEDQGNGNSIPALGSKSQVRGHKQKEVAMQVSKNLEPKSKTKEVAKSHLQTQSKVKLEKPTPSQDINSKAKLSSSYNLGHGSLRRLHKNDSKMQASRR